MVIPIQENGEIPKQMAMACINGKMVIGMRENGNKCLKMDKEATYLATEICIQVNIKRENQMEEGNTRGKMALFMQENSREASKVVKENGRAGKVLNAISLKEIIKMIKSMGMESFNGQVETHTKENIKMMKGMVLER